MSSPASSSASPFLRALARLRLDGALRLAGFFAGLRTLCVRYFRTFVRAVLRRVRGDRRALLVGIQNLAELPAKAIAPAGATTDAGEGTAAAVLHPGRPRAGRKRPKHPRNPATKKKKAAVAASEGGLKGPHHDVEAMRRVLIENYWYHPDDIVTLVDDGNAAHLQPTRENILAQIKLLVAGARDGDRLFFHYAGHASQEKTDDIDEEDGFNELILCCDGHEIMDNELHEQLIKPLKKIKCKLTAVFDCCHSASLLDLPHSHCNDVYVPWMNKGRRRTKTMWANHRREGGVLMPLEAPALPTAPDLSSMTASTFTAAPHAAARTASTRSSGGLSIDIAQCYPSPSSTLSSRTASYTGSGSAPSFTLNVVNASPPPELDAFENAKEGMMSPAHFTNSPAAIHQYCTGLCREDRLLHVTSEVEGMEAEVVCISASKDSELSWEDSQGRSMTQYLTNNLLRNPHPTLRELLTSLSHDIHSYYVSDLHGRARSYKKSLEHKGRRKGDSIADVVEMHNFQNPQLSSFLPLDMKLRFDP